MVILHKLEDLRTRLLDGGDEVIEDVVALFPKQTGNCALVRNAKEREGNKPPKLSPNLSILERSLKWLNELSPMLRLGIVN